MKPFTTLTAIAAPLPMINVDTDMLFPKQYLKTIKRTGLAEALFAELRFDAEGAEKPDFVLNKSTYRNAEIIVAGANFGCGSSREHAAWALLDYGIRAVISSSFADIFYSNCFKNGILPIIVSSAELETLMSASENGSNALLYINLPEQLIILPDGERIAFEIDAARKHRLLNGLDDIELTMKNGGLIDAYERISEERRAALLRPDVESDQTYAR